MKAVIYSDVIQSFILLAGIFVCIGAALAQPDGVQSILTSIPAERWAAIDPALGFSGESGAPCWCFLVGGISDTVIESINKIGAAFYGPILAAFLVGVLSRNATASGMFAGVISGVAFNLCLWVFRPEVFWMWWNFTGLYFFLLLGVLLFLNHAANNLIRNLSAVPVQ